MKQVRLLVARMIQPFKPISYRAALSSVEAPAWYTNKNSTNRKIESSFPFLSCPGRSLFLSPHSP